jgi:hypothetical protein
MNALVSQTPALDLVPQIKEEYEAAQAAYSKAVEHALKVGDLLIQAKAQVKRGWEDWVGEHCPFALRTAQAYMQLARAPEERRNALRLLPLRTALELIAEHREEDDDEESKTIEGTATEVGQADTDEEPNRTESDDDDDAGTDSDDGDQGEPGRTPEQKKGDIVRDVVTLVQSHSNMKRVDLIEVIDDATKALAELRARVIQLALKTEPVAVAPATIAAAPQPAAPATGRKQRSDKGQPRGPRKAKEVTPSPSRAGNDVDTDKSTADREAQNEAMAAAEPADDLDLRGTVLDRRHERAA